MIYYIAQGIGVIAMICSVCSFQLKDQKSIKTALCLAMVLFGVHYFLLGAYTGAIMNAISIVRTYVFAQRSSKKWASHTAWFWGFLVVAAAAGVATWQGPVSLLAMIGMVFSNLSLWAEDPLYVRLYWLPSSVLYTTYNILVGSYPGAATEAFAFTSIIVALFRYYIIPRHKKRETEEK